MSRLPSQPEPLHLTETELLRQLRAGDDAAFDKLVTDNAPRLLAVARRFFRVEEDAEDAVQEAFLSAIKNLERFDERSKLSTWLHRITVNACLMKLRSRRARPEVALDPLLPSYLPDGHATRSTPAWTGAPEPSSLAGPQAAELRALIRDKIEQLPEEYRNVLLLRDIEELDTLETAEVLQISEASVKTRLHRARQALRTLLEPFFADVHRGPR